MSLTAMIRRPGSNVGRMTIALSIPASSFARSFSQHNTAGEENSREIVSYRRSRCFSRRLAHSAAGSTEKIKPLQSEFFSLQD